MSRSGWFGLIAAFVIGAVVVIAYNNNERHGSLSERVGETINDAGRSLEDAGD